MLAILSLPLVALNGFAVFMAVSYGHDIYKAHVQSSGWNAAEGKILSSSVQRGCGKGGGSYYLDVNYTYLVHGKSYRNGKVWFGNGYCGGKTNAEIIAYRYATGSSTPVYYNPNNPAESILVRGLIENGTYFLFLLFISLPCLTIWFVAKDKRRMG